MGAASIMINIPLVTTGSRWCDCVCSYQEQGDMPLPRSRTPHWGTQGEGSHGKTRLKLRYFGAKRCDFAPTSTHYSMIIKSGGWKRVYFFLSCSPLLETLWAFCLCSAFSDVVILLHQGLSAVWLYHIVKGKFYYKCPMCTSSYNYLFC